MEKQLQNDPQLTNESILNPEQLENGYYDCEILEYDEQWVTQLSKINENDETSKESQPLNWEIVENRQNSLSMLDEEKRLKKVNEALESNPDIRSRWWVDWAICDTIVDVMVNAKMVNTKTWTLEDDPKARLSAAKYLAEFSWRSKKTNIINIQLPFKRLSVDQLLNR